MFEKISIFKEIFEKIGTENTEIPRVNLQKYYEV